MIFVITGPAATGKDTLVKNLEEIGYFERIKTVTTRPPRKDEIQGEEYIFIDDSQFENLKAKSEIDFCRTFVTVEGTWKYGLYMRNQQGGAVTGDFDYDYCYICILDPKGALELKKKFGDDVCIVNLMADTELRRQRYLNRTERKPEDFDEWVRREEADFEDFVTSGYSTNDIDFCLRIDEDTTEESVVHAFIQIAVTEEARKAMEVSHDTSNS